MGESFINEYTVLYVFCIGAACQSFLVLRSWKDIVSALIVIIFCFIPAWYIPEPADRHFGTPLIWALSFAVIFSIIFRKSLLPKVTALVIICYTLLLYYVLYLSLEKSGVDMPRVMIIIGLIPGVLAVLLSLSGMLKYKWIRICCFVWYIAALCLVIVCQWSLENMVLLYKETGFSLDLFVYVFSGGGVFLVLISHLVQILLLIPEPVRPGHRIILDAITGPVNYHKEQADMMAGRFIKWGINKWEWIIVLTYPAFLIANAAYNFVPHGIVINLSIIVIFWLIGTTGTKDNKCDEPVS